MDLTSTQIYSIIEMINRDANIKSGNSSNIDYDKNNKPKKKLTAIEKVRCLTKKLGRPLTPEELENIMLQK